jgi:cyanophycinase-like exopeptidase
MGISESTSLVIDQNGLAEVMGEGPVYFVLGNHLPERCEPGRSLTFSDFKIWKVDSGQTFDLKNRPTTSYYLRTVDRGQIAGNPYRSN